MEIPQVEAFLAVGTFGGFREERLDLPDFHEWRRGDPLR